MEITAVPARRARAPRPWALLALALVTPVTVLAVLPTMLGLERYVVANDSMGGDLARGTMVFEERVPVGDIVIGDVVTVPRAGDGDLVTHRVVDVGPGFVRTQADRRAMPDAWSIDTRTAPTLPRVVFAIPFVGHPMLIDLGWWAWGVLVVVAAAALVAAGGRDLGRSSHTVRPRVALGEFVR